MTFQKFQEKTVRKPKFFVFAFLVIHLTYLMIFKPDEAMQFSKDVDTAKKKADEETGWMIQKLRSMSEDLTRIREIMGNQ